MYFGLVKILHNDIVLGDALFQPNQQISDWTAAELEINYENYKENKEFIPNKLILVFKSGVKESVERNKKINDVLRVGSQLFIDEVSLTYKK